MPLVDTLPHYEDLRHEVPSRLDLTGVVIPGGVELTLVGTIHDGSRSTADYAAALFEDNYLLFLEAYGWNPATQKRFQRISRGYNSALQEEKEIQEAEIKSGSLFRKNNALWNLSVAEALHESGVRVVMADVSLQAVTSDRFKMYSRAAARFAGNAVLGLPVAEEDLVTFAERDVTIAGAICEGVSRLRRDDPKIDLDQTLRAVGLYGTVHVQGIADALAALAVEQGTDSFTVNTQYEVDDPCHGEVISAAEFEERQVGAAQMVKFYSDWLRTEPTDAGHLWYPEPVK